MLPACYVLSSSITNLAFKDNLILKGACPNCAAENMSYFGEFGTVPSNNLNVVRDPIRSDLGLSAPHDLCACKLCTRVCLLPTSASSRPWLALPPQHGVT